LVPARQLIATVTSVGSWTDERGASWYWYVAANSHRHVSTMLSLRERSEPRQFDQPILERTNERTLDRVRAATQQTEELWSEDEALLTVLGLD